jgi:hypothetical protein
MSIFHFYNRAALEQSGLTDIAGLQLWLDVLSAEVAAGAFITFADKSGKRNNATAPALANQAQASGTSAHGVKAAAFNQGADTNDYYVLNNEIALTGQYSVFMVVRFDAGQTDEFVLGLSTATGTAQSAGTYTDSKFRWIGQGEAFNANALISTQDMVANRLYVIELRRTAVGRELWINGALDASDNRTSNFSFNVIGHHRTTPSNTSFQGMFYGMSVFARDVTALERQAIYDHYGNVFFGAYARGGFNPQASVAANGTRDYLTPDLASVALPAGIAARPTYIMVEDGNYVSQLPTVLKDHTHIYTKGSNATISMLVNDTAPAAQIQANSALDMFAVNASVDGGVWVSRNARYGLHNEMGAASANLTQTYKNASFIHLGNEGARLAQAGTSIWSPAFAQAGGICSGGVMTFENCIFKAAYGGISMHNQNAIMAQNALVTYKNCAVSIEGSTPHFPLLPWAARCETILGSQAVTTVAYENCTTNKGFMMITVSTAAPLYTNPLVAKAVSVECLPVITGTNNTLSYAGNAGAGIRFKQTALAVRFDNPLTTGSLFVNFGGGNDARPLIWGVRTSYSLGFGNNSFTHGDLDISGAYGANTLANRLGDLRTTPRTFAINSQIVTLNKDYRTMSNAAIIADMNAQLTLVSIYEYAIMNDWRPQIDNFTTNFTCAANQSIITSQLVTLPNGRLAVWWQPISPSATGKVLFAGKVTQHTASSDARAALMANPNLTDLVVELI